MKKKEFNKKVYDFLISVVDQIFINTNRICLDEEKGIYTDRDFKFTFEQIKKEEIFRKNGQDCIVFEDSSNGMKAGYAAGMKCIGVEDIAPFTQDVKETAFRLFDRIDEAIPTLKEYF